jgi:hypothetical protein
MASKITWSTPSAWTEIIGNAAGVDPSSMGGDATVLSIECPTGNEQFIDLMLNVKLTSAPSNPGVINFFIIQSDGSGDEDGDASVAPIKMPVASIAVRSTADQQKIAVQAIMVPPGPFKLLMQNKTNGTLSASDTENTVQIRAYSPEGQ